MNKKLSRYLKIIGLTGALTVCNSSVSHNEKNEDDASHRAVKTEQQDLKNDSVNTSIRNITYYTDTLYQYKSTLMYYIPDKIVRNYVENNNSFRMQMPYFVHEDWHWHNYHSEFRYKYNYSPLEYYKLCMHDEISANLAAILTMRYEYLSSPDKASVIAKYEKTYAGFYFEAVKEGKINPESTNPADNEQEWKFLANGTKDMWMQTYAKQYSPTTLNMMNVYIQKKGFLPSNPGQYNAVKKYMYTIGGVDFSRYMQADIEATDTKPQLVDELSKVLSCLNEKKDFVDEVLKNAELLDSIHPGLRGYAMQHILIAAKLKLSVAGEKNPVRIKAIISTQYNKLMHNMEMDFTLRNFIADYSINELVNNSKILQTRDYRAVIDEIYTYKGVKLNKFISKFSANRVPQKYACLLNQSAQTVLPPPEVTDMFTWYDKSLPPDSLRFEEPIPTPEPVKPRQRMSGELSMVIPNFREPLLTSITPEQRDTLYQMIQDFEKIPAVLKSCNTKEINAYKKQNTKTAAGTSSKNAGR